MAIILSIVFLVGCGQSSPSMIETGIDYSIHFDLIDVEGKNVLKVDCKKSKKHVFLKNGKDEEFYVRNGPSSAILSGSSLIDYINHNFRSF